ncbi:MAG: outer membrane protein assembly factor BamA [Treponema sp.]|jgi:outer membrane protein insertion porin family|nr:outer membrane protein assembly factor BamA [Treponema sp.]
MRLTVTRILFFLVFSSVFFPALLCAQSDEWYQGKPIQSIDFSGLSHVSASELEEIVKPYIGMIFDDTLFLEIQGRLYALEYFDLISPSAVPADSAGTGVIIRFTVTERPIVSRINFAGNGSVNRSELLSAITLKVNDVVNQAKLRIDEAAIVNKYLEKGFPDIKVRSETRKASDSSILLTFFIEEGEKITIRKILFDGNSVFSDGALRGRLSLKVKFLLNDGAFQESKLVSDRAAVIQYYHDRGYIDADVTDIVRTVEKDAKGNNNMTITFKVVEGRKYTFGGITFEGNLIFSTKQLSALVRSKVGETVNAQRLEADFQRVADLYFENGYIFNTIGREENRDSGRGVVSYNIPIVERGRAHIENIIIRGNEKTKTGVILREIPLEPGDVFSKAKITDAMRNLYNLQYFSVVAPEPMPGSEDSLMDLVFTVEEQPTIDVQFGLTFSGSADPDTFPVSVMFKLNDRNFRGSGNLIGGEINASPDTQSLVLNYDHRWIFGLPVSGGFDFTVQRLTRSAFMDNAAPYFYGNEDDYPDGFSSWNEYYTSSKLPTAQYLMKYDQWNFSLGFSTGYRWGTFLGNLTLSGGIRTGITYSTYDQNLYRPFDYVLRETVKRVMPVNSFWTSLALDQRDIYYDPSSGYFLMERIGFYGILPVEREHYFKWETKAEYYHTLLNIPITDKFSFRTIFGIHTGVSFITNQPGRTGEVPISPSNRFAIDGMFIGRGWHDEYSNKGNALWESWAELRIPVVPGILAWDFFLDAAAVKKTPTAFVNSFGIEDMRFSMGGGIRFTIPQFPFRFSLAKRFRVRDGSFHWEKGELFSGNSPTSGLDFVMSFVMSSY